MARREGSLHPILDEVSMMSRLVLAVTTNQEFGFEDVQYALIEIRPDEARRLIARCELAERLKCDDGRDESLFAMEY